MINFSSSNFEGKELASDKKELSDAEKIKIKEKGIHDSVENLFNAYDNGEQRVSLLLELLDPYLNDNLIEEQDEIKNSLLNCIKLNDKNEFIDKVMEIVKPVLSFIDNNPDIKKKFENEQPKEFKRKIFNTFNNFEQVGKYISYGIDGKTLHIHLPDADDLIKGKSRTVLFDELKSDFNNLAKIVDSNDQIKEIVASSWLVASKSNILGYFGFVIDDKSESLDKEGRISKYSSISSKDFLEKYLIK